MAGIFVVGGKMSNPHIGPKRKTALVRDLMAAHRRHLRVPHL
jgi:hypothetical protein